MHANFQKVSKLLILCPLLFSAALWGQKKINLEQAVMGQWREFYPKTLRGVSMLVDETVYSYISDSSILIKSLADNKQVFEITAADLNGMNIDFNRIRSLQWKKENGLLVKTFDQIHKLNVVLPDQNAKGTITLESTQVTQSFGDYQDVHKATHYIAYGESNNLKVFANGTHHQVTNFEDPNIVCGQAIARQEFGISKGTFWSPNGQFLAFYQKDESYVTTYPLVDIGQTPASLFNIKYPMAGQKSEMASIGVYDVAQKTTIYLKTEGESDQYLTNLGWGPKSEYIYIAVVNRAQNHVKLNQYSAKTGAFIKTLFEEKHDRYVEPEHPVWFIPEADNEFLWWSERDGFMHLHRYNTEGKYLGQVSKGSYVDLEIVHYDALKKILYTRGADASGMNTYLYQHTLDGKKTKAIIKKEGQHRFMMHSSAAYVIDNYNDLNTPNKVCVVDLKNNKESVIYEAPNPYSDYQMPSTKMIQLKSKDGTILNARMILPLDFDPSNKYPVIVYVYGGPHAQLVNNSWLGGASLWMHYAADMGYIVFTLDNRGSANRGFEFESCIHRQLGKLEMEDQMVGVEYLKGLNYVDADKMAVHGWSYGGYMTTSLMLKYPDVFKVGVAGGPVTNWAFYEVMYGERYMDRPEENEAGYAATDLSNYAKNLQGDLLLIHGTVDDVVVMQHSLNLVQAFVKQGKLIDFFPYPGHQHNVRGKDRVHLIDKILTYIDEKINN